MQPSHFTTWTDFLDHWQTLAAGLFAVLAAAFTVWWTEGFSRRRERREVEAIKASLAVEIKAFINVLLKAHEVLVKVESLAHIKASSLKFGTELPQPVVYPATADRIGLLGPLAPYVTAFYTALDRINVGVKVVTDVDLSAKLDCGDVRNIARLFEQACGTSLPLLSQLPPGEGGAELRAKIEAMKRFGERK